MHAEFAGLIAACLDDAIASGQIAPCDTAIVAHAWYGAVNQTVLRWLLTGEPERLEDAFPALRDLLLYGLRHTHERTTR